jgi:hypothetical protein
MADVLMNRTETDVYDPFKADNVIESLKEHYKENLKKRKALERAFWDDPPENFISVMKSN